MPRARVLAYLRVSGQEQGRSGTSLEAQREEIARWARANEHASPVFFSEIESGSAARTEARAELARLTSEARPGDVVVVCAVDRWSRDIVHAVASVRALVARGVRWLALREGIDATTRGGDSTLGIMSWAADQERQRIRDRTVGRRVDLKASGIYCEGAIPLGYQRAPGERRGRGLVLDEAGAAIVRQAFEACIAGASLAEIVAKLPLPSGRARWTKTAINDLLRHRVYLGEVQAKPGVWIPGKHPAIITRESFDAAARALAERRIGGRPGSAESRTSSWILRTRARCGLCGAKMASVYSPKRLYYYGCVRRLSGPPAERCKSRYVRVDDAERIAAEKIVERLIALRRVLAKRAPTTTATTARTDRSAELAALAKRSSRVLDAYEREAIGPDELQRRLAKIDAERARIEASIAEESRAEEQARAAADPARRQELLASVRGMRAAWSEASPAERRRIVELLCERAELVTGEEPRMAWRSVEELLGGASYSGSKRRPYSERKA